MNNSAVAGCKMYTSTNLQPESSVTLLAIKPIKNANFYLFFKKMIIIVKMKLFKPSDS